MEDCQPNGEVFSRRRSVWGLLMIHAALLAWSGYRHSPNLDEVGHLPAGISYWQFGTFSLYRVNPPLVRMVAAAPVVLTEPKTDWSQFSDTPNRRPEWAIGQSFVAANGEAAFWYFTLARWACIPLSILGAMVCYLWARDLYGGNAGLLALALWCFSANVLAWGATITPDLGAASMGVLAAYCFWKSLRGPNWTRTFIAGLTLGLAQLTKTTWIVLFPLWIVLWLVYRERQTAGTTRREWFRQFAQAGAIQLVAIYVLNVGYGFEGSFRRLDGFVFVSRTLAGEDSTVDNRTGGNRFAESALGAIRIPLPANYVRGIDLQKVDFEVGSMSYLNGEWKKRGWWYFYLYAAALKVPLGTLGILALAMLLTAMRPAQYLVGWRDELILLMPAVVVFVFVSSQTGFSRYFRYVLPCFPFAMIWMSKVARSIDLKQWPLVIVTGIALMWSVGSSLWVYPHSMSYFNELAGGPRSGHKYLIDSNIDWGQDLLYLKEWSEDHPEARPLHIACFSFIAPEHYGFESTLSPPGYRRAADDSQLSTKELQEIGPRPGWYAISVHRLHDQNGRYEYFLRHFAPVAFIGYSIYVYHITFDEANRVRHQMKLPLLSASGDIEHLSPTVSRPHSE